MGVRSSKANRARCNVRAAGRARVARSSVVVRRRDHWPEFGRDKGEQMPRRKLGTRIQCSHLSQQSVGPSSRQRVWGKTSPSTFWLRLQVVAYLLLLHDTLLIMFLSRSVGPVAPGRCYMLTSGAHDTLAHPYRGWQSLVRFDPVGPGGDIEAGLAVHATTSAMRGGWAYTFWAHRHRDKGDPLACLYGKRSRLEACWVRCVLAAPA